MQIAISQSPDGAWVSQGFKVGTELRRRYIQRLKLLDEEFMDKHQVLLSTGFPCGSISLNPQGMCLSWWSLCCMAPTTKFAHIWFWISFLPCLYVGDLRCRWWYLFSQFHVLTMIACLCTCAQIEAWATKYARTIDTLNAVMLGMYPPKGGRWRFNSKSAMSVRNY